MKKYIAVVGVLALVSCNQIEEKINQSIDTASESVKQKAQETVKETLDKTINETVNSVTNAQDITFTEVFPNADATLVTDFKGRKMKFPNGSPMYFLKYKADKAEILSLMETQPTTDEVKSDKEVRKIDGQKFVDQLSFFEKFIPEGVLDTSFLEQIKTDKTLEFYKINRLPNKSTIIVNPRNNTIYQFVEVK